MQLSRTDWLEQGLQLLSSEGPQHLKIDNLCKVLGVTKGSFYHHFKHHAAYVSALLEHWKITYTQQLIQAVESIDDPRVRSQRLSELVYGKDMRPEVAMRAWANSHAEVAATLHAVDAQRMGYMVELAQRMGAADEQAVLLAKMAYAQLVGMQHLQTFISPADAIQMDHALHAMAFATVRSPS
ncbi:MAG: TetR/AcrR family transcriptional regulator [Hydrogenophaga sp.]|uniref:TetR/AcrR family transcriptional regulator n=1 Tax=Hydrogenophaga sp. TaxID=1904254 RepID=UPI002AB8BA7B|nr:TetR/AcrR family transcriptional regulator [Hydrogenophaga sp.]MDZ4187290.1 TetR/AcrR family transcriptional regulator [Hydrogenophaga sp.]